jgi:DNA-binding MarR family transcriptional regulator
MEEMPVYLEDEEEEDEDGALRIRHEVIEFVLRRFGLLSAPDIARALNWKVGEINHALRDLERSGRVRRTRLGKTYVWTHIEEHYSNKMYY